MKKTKSNNVQIQSIFYYVLRIAQRIALFIAAATAIGNYIWMIAFSLSLSTLNYGEVTLKEAHIEELSNTIDGGVGMLTNAAASWAAISMGIAVAMYLLLPRVRKFEKRFVTDNLVYGALILIVTVMAQPFLRAFLSRLS